MSTVSLKQEGPPDPEATAQEYGIDVEYDFQFEGDLMDGAVAATAKTPGLEKKSLDNYEDFLEADEILMVDGELYGLQIKDQIGFIGNSEVYPELDERTGEHVNLHEAQHYLQYLEDEKWGDVLDEEYDLSEGFVEHLNKVDELVDLTEDPVYRHLVNDAEVTAIVEGYTERVTQAMQEDGEEFKQFYPGYTEIAEHLLEQDGIDPEEEFHPR